jgi:hypothetical protein
MSTTNSCWATHKNDNKHGHDDNHLESADNDCDDLLTINI